MTKSTLSAQRAAFILTLLLCGLPLADAQDASLDVASIESRIAALSSLPEQERPPVEQRYRSALSSLKVAKQHAEREAELRRIGSGAPQALTQVRSALSQDAQQPTVDESLPLSTVRERRGQAEADLETARAELLRLEGESTRRSDRRIEISRREAEIGGRLRALRAVLGGTGEGRDPSQLASATRTALLAERRALQAEEALLEAERSSYEARRELLPARVDLARLEADRGRSLVEVWQGLEAAKQREEADRALVDATRLRQEIVETLPQLKGLAEENHSLASVRTGEEGLSSQLERATDDLETRRSELAQFHARFRDVRRKLDAAGVTRAMGRLLRLELDQLPDVDALERHVARYEEEISDAQFELILREQERRQAGAANQRAEVLRLVPAAQHGSAEPVVEQLLTERRELLDTLIHEQTLMLERLVALRRVAQDQIAAARAYRSYVEARILWVRSVAKPPWQVVPAAIPAVGYLVASQTWPAALGRSWTYVTRHPGWAIAWLLGVGITFLLALGFSRKRSRVLCSRAWKQGDSFASTLEGILHICLQALPIPLLLFAISQLLSSPPGQLEIGRSWGTGLVAAAAILFALRVVSITLRVDGLAEEHFRWRSQVAAHVRWHLRWFTPLATVTAFLVAALDRQSTTEWNDSLGLLAFMTQMCALTVALQRTLHPKHPLVSSYLQRNGDAWLAKLRFLWLPLAVGLPAALAVFALAGFHYSALLLYHRLEATCLLLLTLVLTSAVLQRWIALTRLQLALKEAKQRETEDAEDPADEVAEGDAAPARAASSQKQTELGSRSRQLIRSGLFVLLLVGLYGTWSDVLPALNRLERLQVYPTLAVIPAQDDQAQFAALAEGNDTKPTSPNGQAHRAAVPTLTSQPPAAPGDGAEPEGPTRVTVADLGLSLVLVLLTVLFARNLPALLEIVLLERLPIDDGLRFAIVTVVRYGIVLVGATLAFNVAGIGWSSVQWLAAALTFGLAFGLQEIFANFVSGLIILFERPIRVGDAVTVGEVSGTVTRLRMRATTITDWDNKELIIPNKEFVTGQIINWSLSSPHMRLRLPIGIAYGSDTHQAQEIMLDAARNQPQVLDDPAPTAFFMEFGPSTLEFELRVFIPHPGHRFDVRHGLLNEINTRFAKAEIEISYPQQDVHLKASQPILDALAGEEEEAEAASSKGD